MCLCTGSRRGAEARSKAITSLFRPTTSKVLCPESVLLCNVSAPSRLCVIPDSFPENFLFFNFPRDFRDFAEYVFTDIMIKLSRLPRFLCLLFLGITAGCTTYNVEPVPAQENIRTVFIRENTSVKDAELLQAIEDGFFRHGINCQVMPSYAAVPANSYTATYVGYRGWDFVPYLRDATVNIQKNGRRIASANFNLIGRGGLDLSKFNSTREKISPMMDELLANIGSPVPSAPPPKKKAKKVRYPR